MTIKEKQKLERIASNIDLVETLAAEIKSLESQIRAARLRRNKAIVKLKNAGVSERMIGHYASMAGPTIHTICETYNYKEAQAA